MLQDLRFRCIVDILIKNKGKSRNQLYQILRSSTNFKSEIHSIFEYIKNEKAYQYQYMQILYEILPEKTNVFETFDEKMEIVCFFADFQDNLPDLESYKKTAIIIREIYNSLEPGHDYDNVIKQKLDSSNGKYKGFVLAIFSERFSSLRNELVEDCLLKLETNINSVALVTLCYALRFIKKEDLPSSVNFEKINNLLTTICKSSLLDIQAGAKLLNIVAEYFDPNDFCSLFNEQTIKCIQCLIGNSRFIDSLIFDLILKIPTEDNDTSFTISKQLSSFLPFLAMTIDDFDCPLNEKLIEFVNARKDDSAFKTVFSLLPKKSQSYIAALIIGKETELFKNDEKLFSECFPCYVNPEIAMVCLQSIPKCLKVGLFTNNLIGIVCDSLFSILNSNDLVKDQLIQENIMLAFKSLASRFIKDVFQGFLKNITKIASADIIIMICDYFLKELPRDSVSIELVKESYYCNCVAGLSRFIVSKSINDDGKSTFVNFLEMISVPFDNPDKKVPKRPFLISELINHYIPSHLKSDFIKDSFILFETDTSYSIVLAGFGGLDSNIKKKLFETMESVNNQEIFSIFYSTYCNLNPTDTIKILTNITKSAKKNGIFSRAKKAQLNSETLNCVLLAIIKIISLSYIKRSEDMKSFLKLIYLITPSNTNELYLIKDNFFEMIFIISSSKVINPKEKYIDNLIKTPLYADCLPGLLLKVKPSVKRLEYATLSWAKHAFSNTLSSKLSHLIIDSLFKFYKDQNSYNIIINTLTPFLKEEDPLCAYNFIDSISDYARKFDFKYTADPTELILIVSKMVNSKEFNEIRIAATSFLINLFDLPNELLKDSYKCKQTLSDITDIFNKLFTAIFEKIGSKISISMFSKIMEDGNLYVHELMLIRIILSIYHKEIITTKNSPLFKLLSLKTQKLDFMVVNHIQNCIIFFIKNYTSIFTSLLFEIQINDLLLNCISKIFSKEKLKNKFINEYTKSLVCSGNPKIKKGTIGLLEHLTSLDINQNNSGYIITFIMLWFGILYLKSISSKHTYSSEIKELSILFSKNIKDSKITLSISSIDNFLESIKKCVDYIITMDQKQIKNIIKLLTLTIDLENNNSIHLICLMMINIFYNYYEFSSESSKYIINTSSTLIGKCFSKGKSSFIRIFAYALNKSINFDIFKEINTNDQLIIFQSTLNSINDDNAKDYFNDTSEFLCWMITILPESMYLTEKPKLNNAIKKIFNTIDINKIILESIKTLVEKGNNIIESTSEKCKLSYSYLLYISVKNRQDIEQLAFDILKESTKSKNESEIAKYLIKTLNINEMKFLLSKLTNDITEELINERMFSYLQTFSDELQNSKNEYHEFYQNFIKICSLIIYNPNNQFQSKAIESLSKIC